MVTHLTPGVRLATATDLAALPAVEGAADTTFAEIGMGPLPAPASPEELARAAVVLVVGTPPLGFARLEIVDGRAHLEQLSVHPAAGRRGLGSALLDAAVDWAAEHGYGEMSLITFRDVAWNAPFYAERGFEPVPDDALGAGLRELRRIEREQDGMDALGVRLVMRRAISPGSTARQRH